ncbi:MAG: hypothetical protein GF329_09115, partial [Candidatus Lokiarchaeota archaeon]|nr:hypothetical protein [Candidatus Lokiarchaeota archaeon]
MADLFTIFILIIAIIGLATSVGLTWLLLPKIMSFMKKRDIVGTDIHKEDKPKIPEMGGVALLLSISIISVIILIISILIFPDQVFTYQFLAFILATVIGGGIGIIDDLKRLSGKIKPLLLTLGSLPIFIINFFLITICNPYPYFPLIGSFTINIVYYLIIPIAYSVISNAMNMLDVVNGSMSGSSVVIFSVLCITSIFFIFFPLTDKNPAGLAGLFPSSVEQAYVGLVISSVMLGASLILFKYNKFPAKTFAGDVGALLMGSGISSVAILGGQEFIVVICLLPFVINAFQMLSSVGKVVEGRKLKYRPTKILSDGRIAASDHDKAPMTLMRILLGKRPKKEKEIALDIILLTIFSGILALITMFLTI